LRRGPQLFCQALDRRDNCRWVGRVKVCGGQAFERLNRSLLSRLLIEGLPAANQEHGEDERSAPKPGG
jgi:hypothetical protein